MWIEKDNALQAELVFEDFVTAMGFIMSAAIIAEKMNHHPTWTNTYNKVHILLTTHDAGNTITEKDRLLASKISKLYEGLKK